VKGEEKAVRDNIPAIAAFFLRLVCVNGMISKTEISASYRHISLKILGEFPKVLERVSSELTQQKTQFRISMQTPVENPPMTIESFNRQFRLERRKGKRSSGGGSRKWEKPCSMWSMPIPERPSLTDCQRRRVTGSKRWVELYLGW